MFALCLEFSSKTGIDDSGRVAESILPKGEGGA
jgi:hypothetical protein